MTLLADIARRILGQVLDVEIGLSVGVIAPGVVAPSFRGKQILYRFKRENALFVPIQIKFSPDDPDGELWLLRSELNAQD